MCGATSIESCRGLYRMDLLEKTAATATAGNCNEKCEKEIADEGNAVEP